MRVHRPAEPTFLHLERPHDAIAGYGFYAHFSLLSLDEAWTFFGQEERRPRRPLTQLPAEAG